MGDKLINSFIASIIGCISAALTVWFLTDNTSNGVGTSGSCPTSCQVNTTGNYTTLVVDHLQVNDRLVIVEGETGKPLIEFKGGNAYVQGGIYSHHLGACQIVGQKIQVTPDNPVRPDAAIFAELAINRDQSPYFALLSPQKTHSINFGFDTKEAGYIISQNNRDSAITPQAILPIPQPAKRSADKDEVAAGRSFSSSFR